ncbi:MAG: DUF1573 domain-containing protein, partial [Planctomycetota bacterium]
MAAGLLAPGVAGAQIYYGPPAGGQVIRSAAPVDSSWAEALFSATKHDFGIVARGALTEHSVQIKNTTKDTLQISSIGASCTCASGSIDTQTIAPGETATLTLAMNTRQFHGQKDSNVIVRFQSPRFAEVRIPVSMYCRKDVVLTPGEVNFGAVEKGAGAERTIRIAYAGYSTWKIKEVQGGGTLLTAKATEVGRTSSGADYELKVTLSPDAKPGAIRERLTLITTDANNPKVPVMVEGEVEDDIMVRDVDLGTLAGGQTKRFNVVLRGKEPFKITAMACDGKDGDNFGMKLPD